MRKGTFQILSGILFLLLTVFVIADVKSLKIIYGGLLGENYTGLTIELVSLFIFFLVVVVVMRTKTDMPSLTQDFKTLKEGGFSEMVEKAKTTPVTDSARWFYYSIGMFALALVCGAVTYFMMENENLIPIKIALVAAIGAVGFLICIGVAIAKKLSGK